MFRISPHDEASRVYDPLVHATTIIEEEHRLIHDGMVFFAFGNEQAIPDGESRYWTLRTGNIPPHFKRITIGASEGPVIVTLTENPTITDIGTQAANLVNLNRMSSNLPLTQIFVGTTFSAPGSPVLGDLYVPQQGNQGVSGESSAVEEIILASNTDYLFQLQNDPAGAGTADVYVNLVFYEISYDQ